MTFNIKPINMKQAMYLIVASTLLLSACTAPFKKTGEGMEYKIISDEKSPVIKPGQYFEIHFSQRYKGSNKDTLLFNSHEYASQVVMLDSNVIPPLYYKIFSEVRKGDSVVVRQLTDSILKRGAAAPYMKKGAYIIASYKVMNVFDTKAAADSATSAQMLIARANDSVRSARQLVKDDKIITDYLKKNNIQAVKTPLGAYVQIIQPGEGNLADTSQVMKVFYTGKTLEDGKVFDSNMDTLKNPGARAFAVYMSRTESVIKGWGEGLKLLKKGSKAVFYIPSSLAYGAQGAGDAIKPNSNLVFDIEVADVVPAAQARAEEDAIRKKMEAARKQYMDSLERAEKLKLKDSTLQAGK